MPKAEYCYRCAWPIESQVFQDGGYEYAIADALAILKAKPRRPITLPARAVFERVSACEVRQAHLAHVNYKLPVIAIPYAGRGEYLIIDGNHRAWVRLFKRLPVRAYVLTAKERDSIRKEADE
jgi:hypothetical protein